jgi:hypothetical protein
MPVACGAVSVASVDVTFTKVAGRRYLMTVVRERGPRLAPRHGPGYDDYLPHDAVHFLVEVEARLAGGVFGQIAAGQSNIFSVADPEGLRRQARREAKRIPSAAERADMGRSEDLAGTCQPLWELRAGHRRELPLWWSSVTPEMLELLESPLCERILARLDEFAARWHALPVGRSITLSWPLDGRGRAVQRHETGHGTGRRDRGLPRRGCQPRLDVIFADASHCIQQPGTATHAPYDHRGQLSANGLNCIVGVRAGACQ